MKCFVEFVVVVSSKQLHALLFRVGSVSSQFAGLTFYAGRCLHIRSFRHVNLSLLFKNKPTDMQSYVPFQRRTVFMCGMTFSHYVIFLHVPNRNV